MLLATRNSTSVRGGGWVFYEDLKLPSNAILADQIKRGIGIIPTDNVGCFLRAARYSAIVPGKATTSTLAPNAFASSHDFWRANQRRKPSHPSRC